PGRPDRTHGGRWSSGLTVVPEGFGGPAVVRPAIVLDGEVAAERLALDGKRGGATAGAGVVDVGAHGVSLGVSVVGVRRLDGSERAGRAWALAQATASPWVRNARGPASAHP